jgi:dolichol-phosphate mannosyltransferase
MFGVLISNKRLLKFAISGGISAVVSLSTLYLLTEQLGVYYLASSFIAYCFSFFTNFFLQKLWAFRDLEREKTAMKMGLFLANSVFNLALNVLLMHLLVDYFHVWYLLAQCIVIGTLAVMNYTIYRLYIFRPVVPQERSVTPS